MPSPSWGMLLYMLDVELFLQPHAVRQSTHRVPSPRGCISRLNTQLSNNSYHDNDGETADNPQRTQSKVTMAVTTTRVWLTHVVLQRDFLNAELNIAERKPPSFAVLNWCRPLYDEQSRVNATLSTAEQLLAGSTFSWTQCGADVFVLHLRRQELTTAPTFRHESARNHLPAPLHICRRSEGNREV